MKVRINQHTGNYVTVERQATDSDGNLITVDVEEEILKLVQESDTDEANQARHLRAANLRAEILSRESGIAHSAEVIE
jgi:hypothetical protein